MLRFALNVIAVLIVSYLLPGVHLAGFWSALVLALVLGFLNVIVRPILIFLTLPATIVTVGLFLLVINAVIILMADFILAGFDVEGFWWALLFSLLLWLTNAFLKDVTGESDKKKGAQ
ncbi:MAG: phage holin family protein [Crocinitomicaceae bacterium]